MMDEGTHIPGISERQERWYDGILPLVRKPSRYIGHEWHSQPFVFDRVRISVGLVFPDLYEIGMSHLGLRVLEDRLRSSGIELVDRYFPPAPDLGDIMRHVGELACGLDSGEPLRNFDVIGFSLQTEIGYTNVLETLDLAGVPLLASERSETCPVIIGGGPCAFNPEPLARFFDAFVIGDGEEVFPRIVDIIGKGRRSGETRFEILERISGEVGVYVPSLMTVTMADAGVEREPGGVQSNVVHTQVRRAVLADLREDPLASTRLVPLHIPVHDRVAIEIARGCPNSCRFCQAQVIYRPYRERNPSLVHDAARSLLEATGHEELSLTSLSVTDYSMFASLTRQIAAYCLPRRISLSLPSQRPQDSSYDIDAVTQSIRRTGITLAPEAGTERLRTVLNKQISDAEIYRAIEDISRSEAQSIKLYFMIGLPTETEHDIRGIVAMVREVRRILDRRKRRAPQLNISLSPFVPKPFTPFQWCAQDSRSELRRKAEWIKRSIRLRDVTVHYHDPDTAWLEAVLARGGRELGAVIQRAWQDGARFDGWYEHFSIDRWENALRREGLSGDDIACRERSREEVFPWSFIDTGVSDRMLWAEYQHSLTGVATPGCGEKDCDHCRQCDFQTALSDQAFSTTGGQSIMQPTLQKHQYRYRVHFSKLGPFRHLSHREFSRMLYLALRRADLPLAYTQGFSPHPRISFGDSLPVGYASCIEYADIELLEFVEPSIILDKWNMQLPIECAMTSVYLVPRNLPTIDRLLGNATYTIEGRSILLGNSRLLLNEDWRDILNMDRRAHESMIETLLQNPSLPVSEERKGKVRTWDCRPHIREWITERVDDQGFTWRITLQPLNEQHIRPDLLLRLLFPDRPRGSALLKITKTASHIQEPSAEI